MAKKKNLTDRQKRIRRRRRKSTMSRVVFALEIIILVVLMGGLFVYAKLGNMNYEDLNFENVDVNQSVEENQVMKGYTSIALVGLDSREGELDGDVNSDTMIIASINNDTKKVKLVSIYRDTYLRVGSNSDGENVYNKANSAFCTGGPEKMMTMMNKNLDLNIVDYVTVDFKGVAEAVELLGGIDVDLKEEEIEHLNNYCVETSEVTGMDYTPLKKVAGVHHLNGVQTVAYARIRYTAGNDFRRAARQRMNIVGTKSDNITVEMTNEVVGTTPYKTVYKTDASVPVGTTQVSVTPYTGYTVKVYRNLYENGTHKETKLESTSVYRSRDKVILVNPADAAQYGL